MAETNRLRTAKAFISMFPSLDTSILASILAPSYEHTFAPASLSDHLQSKGKDEIVAHIASLKNLMTGFPMYAKSYWESDIENTVTIWATSKVEWRKEVAGEGAATAEWDFEGEYIFILWMDESGDKVVRALEFLDSLKTVRLMGLLAKAREVAV